MSGDEGVENTHEVQAVSEEDHEGRWDAWEAWILPWLWSCVEILSINAPSEIMWFFLFYTMSFVTGHHFHLH